MSAHRIVSLVPSLTELVWWLGLEDALVGRTRFCTEPVGQIERVAIVGGTKNPKVERIIALRPDLVLANKEENRREDVEALQAAGLRVLVTDPNSVREAVTMIRDLGDELDAVSKAASLTADIEAALARVRVPERRPRIFVAVWKDPWLGLGSESYGHDLLACAGGANVLASRPRYPEVTLAEIARLAPDLILLPDEPYPFKAADAEALSTIAPARVIDGKLLWWYGPRIPAALRKLSALLRDAGFAP